MIFFKGVMLSKRVKSKVLPILKQDIPGRFWGGGGGG
jgi:hypothetical protein